MLLYVVPTDNFLEQKIVVLGIIMRGETISRRFLLEEWKRINMK